MTSNLKNQILLALHLLRKDKPAHCYFRMIANKVFEVASNFGVPEWRKLNYDDINEDAQLLHQCMTKRLKREDDPDYDPDLQIDGGDTIRPPSGGMSEYCILTSLTLLLTPIRTSWALDNIYSNYERGRSILSKTNLSMPGVRPIIQVSCPHGQPLQRQTP